MRAIIYEESSGAGECRSKHQFLYLSSAAAHFHFHSRPEAIGAEESQHFAGRGGEMVEQVSSLSRTEINELLFIGFCRGNPAPAGQNKRNLGFRPGLLWEHAESRLKGVDLNMSNKRTDNFSASPMLKSTKSASVTSAFTTCCNDSNL